jgi:hypothetical protein
MAAEIRHWIGSIYTQGGITRTTELVLRGDPAIATIALAGVQTSPAWVGIQTITYARDFAPDGVITCSTGTVDASNSRMKSIWFYLQSDAGARAVFNVFEYPGGNVSDAPRS